jgi:hypothetical protein
LTHLRLLNAQMSEAMPGACAALSKLIKLIKLMLIAAGTCSPAFLPVLTACVQLTQIVESGKSAVHVLGFLCHRCLRWLGNQTTARYNAFQTWPAFKGTSC